MNRQTAETNLARLFGIKKFYDTQWNVIEKILRGERCLLIEKTGYGKSLCFQFPATQFDGITIVFSPLIALMRDQITKLNQLGISARCLNSNQDLETNKAVIQDALNNKIKILYIAPERME
ncbi:MAG: DEAD/DEAH box helicase, partial [Bacteroidota bacterium]